ncbi:hypothetical protein ABT075_46465 [Streptomyces sp. NPDC002677]|uniref:hypothetical protein n=1 Tax=Streptomyces sp. NPDC002677 TaxID=3154774 RepID=UPI00331EA183
MPSVVGLVEQRELAARRRVDGLREEVDRIQAQLAAAELEWREWVIARRRVDTVLAPDDGVTAEAEDTADPRDTEVQSAPGDATKPKSQVPVWCEGLAWSVLSVDYQRTLQALRDRDRLGQGALICQEMAAGFGLDPVPGKVEALRSKAKRLTVRGWLIEPAPGRFTLAKDVAGQRGGS